MKNIVRNLISKMTDSNNIVVKVDEERLALLNKQSFMLITFLESEDFYNSEIYNKALSYAYNNNLKAVFVLVDDFDRDESGLLNDIYGKVLSNNISSYFIVLNLKHRKILRSSDEVNEITNSIGNSLNEIYREKNRNFIPYVTYSLIAINVLIYILTSYLSNNIFDSNIYVLVALGAKVNFLIKEGQIYRLLTCTFLHGGIMHIFFNMYSLYAVGPFIEEAYGKVRFILIYLFAGITGSIFSYLFSNSVSVGASGAIFGLLGAILLFGIKKRDNVSEKFFLNILFVIGVNLFFGFSQQNIDNFGHIGGIIGGLIISFIIFPRKKEG